MRAYLNALLRLCILILLIFGLTTWLGFEAWVGDPLNWLRELGAWAALINLLLLWSDVILPVPSSLCMIANGSIFGVYYGASLSLIGGVGATLISYYIGKRYQSYMLSEMSESERDEAYLYLTKWGAFAIVISRPVPILAESIAILSGTLPLSPLRLSAYAAIGHLIPCILYAVTGAAIVSP